MFFYSQKALYQILVKTLNTPVKTLNKPLSKQNCWKMKHTYCGETAIFFLGNILNLFWEMFQNDVIRCFGYMAIIISGMWFRTPYC